MKSIDPYFKMNKNTIPDFRQPNNYNYFLPITQICNSVHYPFL